MAATIAKAVKSFKQLPRGGRPEDGRDCVGSLIQLIGMALLIASFWNGICRPDAGAMLGLLVLTALQESPLYFSRVAAGATLITLTIDYLWLHLQAFPGQEISGLFGSLASLPGLAAQLSGRPLQLPRPPLR